MRLAGRKVKIELEALPQIIRATEVQGQVQIVVVELIIAVPVIAMRTHVQAAPTTQDTTDPALIKGRPTGLTPLAEEVVRE